MRCVMRQSGWRNGWNGWFGRFEHVDSVFCRIHFGFIADFIIVRYALRSVLRNEPPASSFSDADVPAHEKTIVIKRIELSQFLAAEILLRPGGSFGYRYLYGYDDGFWLPPTSYGTGSVYDTAEKAEQYARLNAAMEDGWIKPDQ